MTCASDQDCTDSPDGPVCDPVAQVCSRACEPGAQEPCYGGPEGTEGVGACAVGAFRLALLPAAGEAPTAPAESIRGPLGYAGPGSLGGTDSGFGSRR